MPTSINLEQRYHILRALLEGRAIKFEQGLWWRRRNSTTIWDHYLRLSDLLAAAKAEGWGSI
jgi:hypothetical protein